MNLIIGIYNGSIDARKTMTCKSRLAHLMIDLGINSKELAVKSGLSNNVIAKYRRPVLKQIRVSTIEKICNALGCQPWDVIQWEVTNEP